MNTFVNSLGNYWHSQSSTLNFKLYFINYGTAEDEP